MSDLSIFDVAGPIMVGPSSSHTAGACKIGQFARALFHHTPSKVVFYLHGSFGEVYKGHATDRALLGGVMKFRTSDPRIKDSFEIAKKKGIKYEFIPKDLGHKSHPNTVEIVLSNRRTKMSVRGRSIGGGMIEICRINDIQVLLKGSAGKRLSLVVCHEHEKNIIPDVIAKLEELQGMKVTKGVHTKLNDTTITVLGLEGRRITLPEVIQLEKDCPEVHFIRSLSKLQKQ